MKIVIEYNLPDDAYEYNKASNATAYMLCLQELHEWLRSQVKYAPEEMTQEVYDTYEMIYEKLSSIIAENNATLYPDEYI